MRDDLDGMAVFAAVAEAGGFRAAAERLGVTRSAVSQTLQRLEDRLGVALVERTTRSVRLTDAGRLLHAALRPALDEVRAAVDAIGELRRRPAGTLRLSVSSIAESFLRGPALADFLAAHPDVRLEVMVDDGDADVIGEGFDAGIRLGEAIDDDMIAVRASAEQRQLVVGAPAYLARHGAPAHPRDLLAHTCIGWQRGLALAPYQWEFTEPPDPGDTPPDLPDAPQSGRDFAVAVRPRVATNDMALMVRLACAGVGLITGMEETFRGHLARGELIAVLEPFCPPFPGFYLYYPRRRHPPAALRALVAHLRRGNVPPGNGAAATSLA